MAGRHEVLPLVGAGNPPCLPRRRRLRLHTAGHHDAIHASPHRRRGSLHRGQTGCAVAVVRQAGRADETGLYGRIACDVTAAVERFAQDDVVDPGGFDA